MIEYFLTVWIRFFFLLTPFFALSLFLVVTKDHTAAERRSLAIRSSLAVVTTCFVLYFIGQWIFSLFGITLDAFRVGAGSLLMLSAIDLVRGGSDDSYRGQGSDLAVVPLAIPVIVGPATTGALLVMGAEVASIPLRLAGCAALVAAVACVGSILLAATGIERLIGSRGINILSKLTGLVLSALAAQLVLTGVRNLLR